MTRQTGRETGPQVTCAARDHAVLDHVTRGKPIGERLGAATRELSTSLSLSPLLICSRIFRYFSVKMIHPSRGTSLSLSWDFALQYFKHYSCSVLDSVRVYCNYVLEFHCFYKTLMKFHLSTKFLFSYVWTSTPRLPFELSLPGRTPPSGRRSSVPGLETSDD